MRIRFRTRFHPVFLATALVFPVVVEASCGLQSCPRPAHETEAAALEFEIRTRWVSFDADSLSGSYAVLAPRLLWRPFSRWTLGVEVPVTRLQAGGEVHTGLSNPLLTALYARRLSHAWSGEAGLQLELPLGDADRGLADDHTMILPWIGLRRDLGDVWNASALIGFSRALEAEDASGTDTVPLAKVAHNGVDHGAANGAPVYVNPHGDREIQWRFGVTRLLGPSMVEAFALGQMDVSNGVSHHPLRARRIVVGICADPRAGRDGERRCSCHRGAAFRGAGRFIRACGLVDPKVRPAPGR
jgi:hypothetical protein